MLCSRQLHCCSLCPVRGRIRPHTPYDWQGCHPCELLLAFAFAILFLPLTTRQIVLEDLVLCEAHA